MQPGKGTMTNEGWPTASAVGDSEEVGTFARAEARGSGENSDLVRESVLAPKFKKDACENGFLHEFKV